MKTACATGANRPRARPSAFPGQGNPHPRTTESAVLLPRSTAFARTRSPKKSRRLFRQTADLTFRCEHCTHGPLASACEAFDVSESGDYGWTSRSPSRAELRQEQLLAAIRLLHAEVKGHY